MQLSQLSEGGNKNVTSAAACQPSCRRSFSLKFASKYYPLHSLLSPITGSLSAHLIHRQPVAQPSVLFGRCQAVSPSSSSRIHRLLNLYRISAGTQNCYPKLGSALLVLGPLPLQEFPPFLFHLWILWDFQGSAQSRTSSRKSSQNAPKFNLLEKT